MLRFSAERRSFFLHFRGNMYRLWDAASNYITVSIDCTFNATRQKCREYEMISKLCVFLS